MKSPAHLVTVLMTGGHITPAIASIEEIQARFPTWRIIFVGRMHALEGQHAVSEEYRLVTALGIPFFPIVAGRLKREGGIRRLLALWKVPVGFFQALGILRRERPHVVVSFGGYVALPVAVVARALGIPVVTHEQTTRPGLANRVIARIATEVCVTFPHTVKRLGKAARVTVTGLPIRKSVLAPPSVSPFGGLDSKPLLLIVGGSTGSVSINEVVFRALKTILKKYSIIHQVGDASQVRARIARRSLSAQEKKSYLVKTYLSAPEYSWALHHAKIVIGRSGANTVMELMIAAAVAICIPLPWSAGNEQLYNARQLLDGGSLILTQDHLFAETLVDAIERVMANWDERKDQARNLAKAVPRSGASSFVSVIERVIASS